jgi:outer membrane protein assembly factor BamB
MKINKKILLILIISLLAVILGACSSGRRVLATGWSGITTREDVVYFSYGPHAFAVNLDNGSQRWQFPLEPIKNLDFYATPVFADEESQLILASYFDAVYSVDPATGLENWSFSIADDNPNTKTRFIAAPLATKDTIYAPASNKILYALDFDGALKWKFETEEPIWASPVESATCGCIYLASMDHHLYALDPEDGKLLWKSEDLGGPIVSKPVVSETGLVLVSTFGEEVIALNEESQEVVWRFQTADWAWANPVIDNEQVYASDISGQFYALDLATGELIWQVQPGGEIVSPPLVKDDLIYISTTLKNDSNLVVISSEGVVQRNLPIENKLYASPATNGDKILLAPSEAKYYLLALNMNGAQIWGFPPADK